MKRCHKCYVLADSSKFDVLSNVSFGCLANAAIITADVGEVNLKQYKQHTEVIEL